MPGSGTRLNISFTVFFFLAHSTPVCELLITSNPGNTPNKAVWGSDSWMLREMLHLHLPGPCLLIPVLNPVILPSSNPPPPPRVLDVPAGLTGLQIGLLIRLKTVREWKLPSHPTKQWPPTWSDIMVNPTDRNDSIRKIIVILIAHHSLDALVYL